MFSSKLLFDIFMSQQTHKKLVKYSIFLNYFYHCQLS